MRTVIALALACPLVVSLSVVALPAQARDCAPVSLASNAIAAGPSPLEVGTAGVKTVLIAAHLQDTCSRVVAVQAKIRSPRGGGTFDLGPGRRDPVSAMTVYGLELSLDPTTLFNDEAGPWSAVVTAHQGEPGPGASASAPNFSIVRAARLSVQAGPETVAKGKDITVTGSLTRANWETAEYRGYAGRRVDLQFRTPTGPNTWVKTIVSDPRGRLETTVRATGDGCYRLVYGGNRATGSAKSTSDCIDVT